MTTTTAPSIAREIADTAELIQAGNDADFTVTTTARGWIEIRNNPARQIDPNAKLDMLRLVCEDEGYWKMYHLTHNGVIKGEAAFSHSMVSAMFGIIDTFFATL